MYHIENIQILCDSMMNDHYQASHFMEILITAHKGGWYGISHLSHYLFMEMVNRDRLDHVSNEMVLDVI